MVAARNPLILLINDDRFVNERLQPLLQRAGFDVVTRVDSAAVDASTAAQPPDAILITADSACIDAARLCSALRAEPRFRATPILIVTAGADTPRLETILAAGCDDFLQAPLEPLVVVARISGLLKKADYAQQLEATRAELSRYVSPRVRAQIESRVGSGRAAAMPTPIDACVLFSDVRGFTALSRTLEPTQLFSTVSHNLGLQVDCVHRHHGYVDTFGGDGLMAIFDGESMVADACHCALEIMAKVGTVEFGGECWPVPLGIGIHAGPVVVGNIGSGDHMDHTAIGETVNIAARLCGHAGSECVIVSAEAARRAAAEANLHFAAPQFVAIRGLPEPVSIHQLLEQPPA